MSPQPRLSKKQPEWKAVHVFLVTWIAAVLISNVLNLALPNGRLIGPTALTAVVLSGWGFMLHSRMFGTPRLAIAGLLTVAVSWVAKLPGLFIPVVHPLYGAAAILSILSVFTSLLGMVCVGLAIKSFARRNT